MHLAFRTRKLAVVGAVVSAFAASAAFATAASAGTFGQHVTVYSSIGYPAEYWAQVCGYNQNFIWVCTPITSVYPNGYFITRGWFISDVNIWSWTSKNHTSGEYLRVCQVPEYQPSSNYYVCHTHFG